ncbi:MAG TPA: acyl-CoA dehydrogenase family protein, partial [Ilumatobacteraceae bacterium]|nr:acyl-CoA dehydrogenase family protein [Ilumatobacteraceae bacterium]
AAPGWPVADGGRGLPPNLAAIWREEEGKRNITSVIFTVSVGMAGPVLLNHGTAAQRQRFIDPMLRGDEVWCQLFSEPDAGSDLAALRTSAVRDGDQFIVNGQKVWSSGAHYSQWGILLARTNWDVPKHRGITFFVVDMASPGIEVRPLRQITGAAEFNEVYFHDVAIPVANVVGQVDGGWGPTMTTLTHERTVIGRRPTKASVAELAALAAHHGRGADPLVRQQLARVHTQMEVIRWLGARTRARLSQGGEPGPESSVMKVAMATLVSCVGDLGVQLQGAAGMLGKPDAADDGKWVTNFLAQWGFRIAGGTDEIQRNTIGERVLGLPGEPRLDKDVPFRDIPR